MYDICGGTECNIGLLVKWLAHLVCSQKIVGSRLTLPALLCKIYYSGAMKVYPGCLSLCGTYLLRLCATVFQIERKECNIPVSIGRLLGTWLAVQAFG